MADAAQLTAKASWNVLKSTLNTGDLIFFKCAKPTCTSSLLDEWTSVNVVIKLASKNLTCLVNIGQNLIAPTAFQKALGMNATAVKAGQTPDYLESGTIEMIDVDDKMRYQSAPGELTYSEIQVHRLKELPLNAATAELLGEWIRDVVGSEKHELAVAEAIQLSISNSKETLIDASELFSASFAAEFYRTVGIFPKHVKLTTFTSPGILLLELEKCNVAFEHPVILEIDPSHKPRSWQDTLTGHGDYGRHISHDEMVQAQDTSEWMLDIPETPTNAFQQAKSMRDQFLHMAQDAGSVANTKKEEHLKVQARNLFEVALMNENYYATNHPADKKKMVEIEENLQMLSA